MLLHLSVILFIGWGVCLSACWDTHPSGADTPLPPGADTPLRSACWEIRATSGQYASYWNAYLFLKMQMLTQSVVCLGGGCLPGGRGVYTFPLWTEILTHTCENITFPQLHLRTEMSL